MIQSVLKGGTLGHGALLSGGHSCAHIVQEVHWCL